MKKLKTLICAFSMLFQQYSKENIVCQHNINKYFNLIFYFLCILIKTVAIRKCLIQDFKNTSLQITTVSDIFYFNKKNLNAH